MQLYIVCFGLHLGTLGPMHPRYRYLDFWDFFGPGDFLVSVSLAGLQDCVRMHVQPEEWQSLGIDWLLLVVPPRNEKSQHVSVSPLYQGTAELTVLLW